MYLFYGGISAPLQVGLCDDDDGHIQHVPQRKGERIGIWELHIQAMYEMMPCLAASVHNLYTKCLHNILAPDAFKLHETHPEVSRHFDQWLHVVRRLDRLDV